MAPTTADPVRRSRAILLALGPTLCAALLSGCAVSLPEREDRPAWRTGSAPAVFPTPVLRDMQGDQATAYDFERPEYARRDGLVLPRANDPRLDDCVDFLDIRWRNDRYQVDRNQLLPIGRRVSRW